MDASPPAAGRRIPRLLAAAISLLLLVPLATAAPHSHWVPVAGAPIDDSEVLKMVVGLRRRNMDELDQTFWAVSDPTHPRYGEHLSQANMRHLIAPTRDAMQSVLLWLAAAGVPAPRVSSLEDALTFDAPIAVVRKLLPSVEFAVFEHRQTRQRLTRASSSADAVLPAVVRSLVEVVAGHGGFPAIRRPRRAETKKDQSGSSGSTAGGMVTPQVLYSAYNVTRFPATPSGMTNVQSFFQAQGQAVLASDLTTFCDRYLPSKKCSINTYIGDTDDATAGIESSLDSQYITAASNGQETWVWSYNSDNFCADLLRWSSAVLDLTKGTHPSVISMSYGSQYYPNVCGAADAARLERDIQVMGTMGISVLIASGDDGSGEWVDNGPFYPPTYNGGYLQPSMPSTIPYATAVGATTFISGGTSGEEEAVTAFGSGGGFSFSYPAPAYQTKAIAAYFSAAKASLPPATSYNKTGRGTPDVSALGWNFELISGGQWQEQGGTSASTPTFAGFVTLLNNVRLQANKTLGFLNPLFYQNPSVFTDITVGNNDVYADGNGWVCTRGWDPVTGLGTPNVGKLFELVERLNAKTNGA